MATFTQPATEAVKIPAAPPPPAASKKLERLLALIRKQYDKNAAAAGLPSFSLREKDGPTFGFGANQSAFTLVLKNDQAVSALSTLDENTIAEDYLLGHIDVEGDITAALSLRNIFHDRRWAAFVWRFIRPLLFGQVKSDKKWIAQHYDTDAGFFQLFLDKRHRAYSQAVFANESESLEEAESRKLDFALQAVGAKPGDHLLDIGSGWGAVVEYAGKKGIRVTSLTISKQSQAFVQKIIDDNNLPCQVLLEHFFEHSPAHQYDGIINCGVTEHLPDYKASLKHYLALLKPGGRLYLDASADAVKHGHGSFINQFVFEGNGSLLCLHEYLTEVAKTPFQLRGVWDDQRNYYLTTKAWADRLEANRKLIEQRWGQQLFRIFQLYLLGSAEGFRSGKLQAYRVVLQKPVA